MLLFCAISCAKKAGIDHTFSAEQGIKRQIEYGETLFDKGKYDQAADIFKEILKYYPENVIAHYRLGVISGKQGDMKKSAGEFENVVYIDNNHHKAFYNLGVIYSSQGPLYSLQMAADNFNRYLALDPYSANRKKILDWFQSHGLKFNNIEPNIGMDRNENASKDEDEMIFRADRYIEQQEFDKAESLYKAILNSNPRNSIAYYKLGVMYMKQEAFANGRTELLKAISIDPGFSKAYFNLGVLYSIRGETYDVEKAEFFFRKYLTFEPDSSQKERIEAWRIKNETVNVDWPSRESQEFGKSFPVYSPNNFKNWLENQAGELSNAKEIEE
ncbi:MAG: tetratricopeptide repeat protein [Desulfobacteraceae bacterium]|nr:tetratricopeptide repeat protein [Desulfobacteraceae bacterium]